MKTRKNLSEGIQKANKYLSLIEMKKINGGVNPKPATGGGGTNDL